MDDTRNDPLGRYDRQMLLMGVGREGQARLAASHAAIIGCGALGCGVADLLARAGVGTLTIIDRDVVEPTNLQRQVLFDERHVAAGLPKAEAARLRLGEINSAVRVISHVADLNAATVNALLPDLGSSTSEGSVGVLVDGTDNFQTRLLVNDLCVSRRLAYVYAGVLATRGMALALVPWLRGPCLRCLVERPPAPGSMGTCDTVGVLGAAVARATALQAAEAIKVLLGRPDLLSTDLVEFDPWTSIDRRMPAAALRDPACACCVGRDFAYLEGRAGTESAVLCGRGSVQIAPGPGSRQSLDLAALAAQLERSAIVTRNAFLLRAALREQRGDRGEAITLTVFRDGRVIVTGMGQADRARSLCDRYLGG